MPARFPRPDVILAPARLRFGVDLLFPDLGVGNLRLRDRQRHVAAGLDHVELARKQHDEAAGMADATGDAGSIVAGAPIEVRARRPTMADPVSCAIIRRRNGVVGLALSTGSVASMKNGVP
jgi:hypothetical protein